LISVIKNLNKSRNDLQEARDGLVKGVNMVEVMQIESISLEAPDDGNVIEVDEE